MEAVGTILSVNSRHDGVRVAVEIGSLIGRGPSLADGCSVSAQGTAVHRAVRVARVSRSRRRDHRSLRDSSARALHECAHRPPHHRAARARVPLVRARALHPCRRTGATPPHVGCRRCVGAARVRRDRGHLSRRTDLERQPPRRTMARPATAQCPALAFAAAPRRRSRHDAKAAVQLEGLRGTRTDVGEPSTGDEPAGVQRLVARVETTLYWIAAGQPTLEIGYALGER